MRPPDELVYIYALVDPRDHLVRYIGQSSDPHKRLWYHIFKPTPATQQWISDLSNNHYTPELIRLEATTPGNAREYEQYYIDQLLDQPLLNRQRALAERFKRRSPR